jgi:hypothetical protein
MRIAAALDCAEGEIHLQGCQQHEERVVARLLRIPDGVRHHRDQQRGDHAEADAHQTSADEVRGEHGQHPGHGRRDAQDEGAVAPTAEHPREHVEQRHLVDVGLGECDHLPRSTQMGGVAGEDLVEPQAAAVELIEPQGHRQHADGGDGGRRPRRGPRRRASNRPQEARRGWSCGVRRGRVLCCQPAFRPDASVPKYETRRMRSPIHCSGAAYVDQ